MSLMHLDELNLWNFRKFGSEPFVVDAAGQLREPDLQLTFNEGLNLIIGENDSGKSAIVDAIKLICKTTSNDWIRIEEEDFFSGTDRLRIECIFRGFESEEAKHFVEWLGREEIEGTQSSFLKLNLEVQKNNERIFPSEVKGGPDIAGTSIDAGARELLQLTYLKALRDAKAELTPRRNSRLSKILASHKAFKGKEDTHHLQVLLNDVKVKIDEYFRDTGTTLSDNDGRTLKKDLDKLLTAFFPTASELSAQFGITGQTVKGILEGLRLTLTDEFCGLGSDNLLFIATELLLLQRDPWSGLRLGLTEEIEAHLHPQAQMRIVEYLQKEARDNSFQLILTSHSPNLASKVELENLIVCTSDGQAFSMAPGQTKLDQNNDDYRFLRRFLDVTKANLFFAKGVILVEGYAEELLIPAIAEKIGKPLTKHGVSVVNVGSAAFLRFGKIFLRNDGKVMPTKVAIITDYDFRPSEFSIAKKKEKRRKAMVEDAFSETEREERLEGRSIKEGNVSTFFSPKWTLEYCLALSPNLRKEFYLAVLKAWAEKKRAGGIKSTKAIGTKIENLNSEFSNWGDSAESIAYSVYKSLVLDKQLSKAAIAQYFARSIETDEVEIDQTDKCVKYLTDAITFVTE